MEEINADVLIIGGGAAGAYSALRLADAGADVVLATKGLLAKSGCSTKVVYYMHPGQFVSPDSEDLALQGWIEAFSCYLADQELLIKINELNKEIVPELERLGVLWRRYSNGKLAMGSTGYVKKVGGHKLRNLLASRYGETGKAIAETLRNHLLVRNVKIREEVTATSILSEDNAVQGAVFLDYAKGKLFAVNSKAVILATGTGGGYIWTYSTSPREMTGDGLALAYRAGAELVGIEFQLWHAAEIASPSPWNRSLYVYPFAVPPEMEVPHLVDADGNRFMPELEESAMWKQCNTLYERLFRKGKATKNGGYYADLRHMNVGHVRDYNMQYGFFEKLGKDITRDLIEIHMSVHTMLGGVRINSKSETSLRGLYAVGTAAGTFLPTLHAALGTARIAADEAQRYIADRDRKRIPKQLLAEEEGRIASLRKTGTGAKPAQIKYQIRRIMNEKMDYMKTGTKMEEVLAELDAIRRRVLPTMVIGTDSEAWNYDLVESLDVQNMLELSELIVRASLLRKESRGPFQREDYPLTDDAEWLKNIVVRKVEDGPSFRFVPVELLRYRPVK